MLSPIQIKKTRRDIANARLLSALSCLVCTRSDTSTPPWRACGSGEEAWRLGQLFVLYPIVSNLTFANIIQTAVPFIRHTLRNKPTTATPPHLTAHPRNASRLVVANTLRRAKRLPKEAHALPRRRASRGSTAVIRASACGGGRVGSGRVVHEANRSASDSAGVRGRAVPTCTVHTHTEVQFMPLPARHTQQQYPPATAADGRTRGARSDMACVAGVLQAGALFGSVASAAAAATKRRAARLNDDNQC